MTDIQNEFQKELKRRTINKELMMIYGHEVGGYLPPLPSDERPRSSLALAWSCENPALRQLGNLSRRGPRQVYLSSPTLRSSLLERPQLERPHTAYTSHVRQILNRQFEEERPHTSMAAFESMPCRRLAPQEDLEKLITPAMSLARAGVCNIDDDDMSDYMSVASVSSLQRKPRARTPGFHGILKGRKKKKKRSNQNQSTTADAKRREETIKVLRGEWDSAPSEPAAQVRIYLCANGADMVEERKVLFRIAFPELQEHCRQQGLEFHVVDLRWGSSGMVDSELAASGLHLKEISSCQRHSIGPCFLGIIGDKYGTVAPPQVINKEEFEAIKQVAEESRIGKTYLLEEWYAKDENSIPHIYVLQTEPTGNSYKSKSVRLQALTGKEAVRQMHDDTLHVLQEAITIATKQSRLHADKKHRYFQSVLEDEVNAGMAQLDSPADHCMAYFRNITDVPTHVVNDISSRYIDVNTRGKKPSVDDTARRYLSQLKTNIRNRLSDGGMLRSYDVTMKEYILKEHNSGVTPYLEKLCADVIRDVKELVQKAQEAWGPSSGGPHDKLLTEVHQHAKVCHQRASIHIGRHAQLSSIQTYIKSPTGRPLIVHGPFGLGKSALMAKTARMTREWLGDNCVVIARFLGITSESNNIKSVLQGIILQLCAVYNLEVPSTEILDSPDKMSRTFVMLVGQISRYHGEANPLVILLDGVDILMPAYRCYGLSWLPFTLPPHVRLIVSTDAYRYGILHRLRQRLNDDEDFIEISEMPEKTVEDIFVRMLQKRNRQVTNDQRDLLMRLIKGHRRPLYTTLMTNEALSWGSYTIVLESMLPEITEDAIWRLLVRTENKYGPNLLQYMFSFLVVVPLGLTEVELRDALSCTDEVMEEVLAEYDIDTESTVSMPSFLLSQLLHEVRGFLSERETDGKTVIVFQHSLFRQVCSRKYFGTDNMLAAEAEGVGKVCKVLAEIFLQETGIKRVLVKPGGEQRGESLSRCVTAQPLEPKNIRKLKMLPYLISLSVNFLEIRDSLKRQCLCSFRWLYCKLQVLPVDSILMDFSLVEQRDNDLDLIRDFFVQNQQVLKQDPSSLAAQLLGCIPRLGPSFRLAMELVDQAKTWLQECQPCLMAPIFPSFPSAHELCKAEMWGLAELMVIDRSMQLGVVRKKDSTVEVWDIRTCELVHQLGIRLDKVIRNIFYSDIYVLSLCNTELKIWDIESGICAHECDLEELLGDNMSTLTILAHTRYFEHVAVHAADEEFNQVVAIIDTRFNKMQLIQSFGLQDEFYPNSAVFTDGGEELIFVNGTSQRTSDVTESENVPEEIKLHVYSLVERRFKHRVPCGQKPFHSLHLRDRVTVLICWMDASFDLYDIVQGSSIVDMPAPGHNLKLHQYRFTKEHDLMFLASQTGSGSCFSALWLWDVEDQQLAQLLLQEHEHSNQLLKQFIYLDGFNYVIILSLDTATFYLFDTNKGEWICSIEAHSHPAVSMVTTTNPFSIYTCSAEEGVLRLWNLHRLFPRYLTMKTNIPVTPILVNKGPEISFRRPSSRRMSRSSKTGSAKSNKSVRFADEATDDDASSIKSYASSRRELVTVATEETLSSYFTDDPLDGEIKDYKEEMEAMFGITCAVFSLDSQCLLTGSERHLPTVWDTSDGHILYSLPPQREGDIGTPWLNLACSDQWVVGLTMTATMKDSYPHIYTFQVWDLKNNKCVPMDMELEATACCLTSDRERALVATTEAFDPTGEANWVVNFKLVNLNDRTLLNEVVRHTQTVPTILHLSEDDKYVVTNNKLTEDSTSSDATSFPLMDPSARENTYRYQKGKKDEKYEMSFNVVLKNGLSVAVGCHGDLQLWDIQTCEYEGNLCQDRTVKDTRNPCLVNHNGRAIICAEVSKDGHFLLSGSEDGSASLWDLEEETMIHTYGKHESKVVCVTMSSDNHLVVIATEGCIIEVFERSVPERILCSLFVHVLPKVLMFSPDKEMLLVSGSRRSEVSRMHILRLYNIPNASASKTDH